MELAVERTGHLEPHEPGIGLQVGQATLLPRHLGGEGSVIEVGARMAIQLLQFRGQGNEWFDPLLVVLSTSRSLPGLAQTLFSCLYHSLWVVEVVAEPAHGCV